MPNTIMEVNNLSLFAKEIIPLNWTYRMEKGQVICIQGTNGVGKSTLLHVLAGLKSPHFGSIKSNEGIEVAYLPQKTSIPSYLPMDANTFCLLKAHKNEHDKQLMQKLNVDILMHDMLSDISGGELQRVLLYATLIENFNVALMDEPDSSLDDDTVDVFFKIITDMAKNGKTFVIISHNKKAIKYSHHVLNLNDALFCQVHQDCCL